MPSIEVRDADDADLVGILQVLAEAGIDDDAGFTPPEARAHLAELRRDSNFRLLVAIADGEIAGTYTLLILGKLGKRGRPAGVVEDVAVAPRRQGQGIGRAMMQHALDACREAGCYKLALSSNKRREGAHRFYESLGFERHGYSFAVFL
jgi:GNAT superfamily N-acetyltransferase